MSSKKYLFKLSVMMAAVKSFLLWILIAALDCVLAAGPQLLVRPLWFQDKGDYHTNLTSFEFAYTSIIFPLTVIILNYALTKWDRSFLSLIMTLPVIVGGIYISEWFHFLNWADSVGRRTHPDADTIVVRNFERFVGFVTLSISYVVFAMFYIKERKKRPWSAQLIEK